MKWLRRLAITLVILCILLLICVGFLRSESGTRFFVYVMNSTLAPNLIIIPESGKLFEDGLVFKEISYTSDTFKIAFYDGLIALKLADLRARVLTASTIVAKRMTYTETLKDDSPDSPIDVRFPFKMSIQQAQLKLMEFHLLNTQFEFSDVDLAVTAQNNYLDIEKLNVVFDGWQLVATARLLLKDHLPLQGVLHWQGPIQDYTLGGVVAVQGDVARLKVDQTWQQPIMGHTTGWLTTGAFETPLLQTALNTRWPAFKWQDINIGSGHLHLRGTWPTYELSSKTAIQYAAYPLINLNLRHAIVDANKLSQVDLRADINDGWLDLQGEWNWQQHAITSRYRFVKLTPAMFNKDWQGQLSGGGRVHWRGTTWQKAEWGVELVNWVGTWRGHAFFADGQVYWRQGALHSPGFRMNDGVNDININAAFTPSQWQADSYAIWHINAPALENFWPSLAGSIIGHGYWKGRWPAFDVQADVQIKNFRYEQFYIDEGYIKIDPRFSETEPHYKNQAVISLKKLHIQDFVVDSLNIDWIGQWNDWRGHLIAQKENINTEVTFSAKQVQDSDWSGRILAWNISVPLLGSWQLSEEVDWQWLDDTLMPISLPWASQTATSRVNLQGNLKNAEFSGEVQNFAVHRVLADWLSSRLQVEGNASAVFRGNIKNAQPMFSGEIDVADGLVLFNPENKKDVYRYPWQRGHWQFKHDSQLSEFQGQLNIPGIWEGDMLGQVQKCCDDNSPVNARIKIKSNDVAWLEGLDAQIDAIAGQLNIDLSVVGTLSKPTLLGGAYWHKGRFGLASMGVVLEDIELQLEHKGNGRLHMEMVFKSDGYGHLRGDLIANDWQDWRLNAALSGKNLKVFDTEQLKLWASPELQVDWRSQGITHQVNLQGKVDIPRAKIEPRELPKKAIRRSADEVIVNQSVSTKSQDNIALTSDLEITLGEEIQFLGFGVLANLEGQMNIYDQPGKKTRASGEIRLKEGQYQAYGQKLTIEQGRFIFQGPLDNPGLDVTATRTVDDYRVGLVVTGTLRDPKSRVFSEPAVSDSEALSLLVLGKPLSTATETDTNSMWAAVASLGLLQSENLREGMSDTFKIDHLSVDTDENRKESALLIGKYITPALYVQYSVGLFDQLASWGVHYTLDKNWRIEVETGYRSSLDLLYQIERD
ncbi:MAG: translocation/assembly module TamB domain-containing protein [Gammaproteobacteria bacterium]|nr:translocation/assembly module TamB domain-containing protein [Gammaproteobacteria bacterium]